jgi:hypothetical protein
MLIGHVGVFIEDSHGLKDVYNEWYQKTERDFIKVWINHMHVFICYPAYIFLRLFFT